MEKKPRSKKRHISSMKGLSINGSVPYFTRQLVKRHTNFAQESVIIRHGTINSFGSAKVQIPKHGDLVSDIILCIETNKKLVINDYDRLRNLCHRVSNYINRLRVSSNYDTDFTCSNIEINSMIKKLKETKNKDIVYRNILMRCHEMLRQEYKKETNEYNAYRNIKEVKLTIGETQLDKYYSDWLISHADLTDKSHLISEMTKGILSSGGKTISYLPLPFWFCKDSTCSLPIFSLKEDPVLDIKFNNETDLELSVIVEYTHIEKDERKELKDVRQLITQMKCIDYKGVMKTHITLPLETKRLCKNIFWIVSGVENCDINTTNVLCKHALIQLDDETGVRQTRSHTFYDTIMAFSNYSKTPRTCINSMSFCLKPESSRYTGSSKLDTGSIYICTNKPNYNIRLYIETYNVLIVKNGVCKTVFT